MILVTGGAGFIGSNFVLDWLAAGGQPVVNLDKLTYAGNLRNLAVLAGDPRHVFVRGDIGDRPLVERLLAEHRVRAVVHFAAESHVDRSIHGPADFVDTNIVGNADLMNYDNDNYSILFQQRLAPSLYLEIAARHDHNYRFNREMDGNNVAIRVDPNAQLPDGRPNPFQPKP